MKENLIKEYAKEIHAPFEDSLTGLFNHGIFQILLREEVKRAQRYGDPFTLAFINIDSFSLYNKLNGSAIGDQALQAVTKFIRENLRTPDVAARYSGDEFAVILPKSSVCSAYTALERIRTAVGTYTQGKLTLSTGLASFPSEASDKEGLIQRAQEALLQAKIRGKNRVCFLKEEKEQIDSEQKFKILIVDDDPRNVKLLEAVMAPFHHEIFKAYNGEDALSLIKKIEIDLVLLDIMMPHMDGYEVCRRLKRNEATRQIPIIMVTALDDTKARVEGIEAGADDFITKPPNKIELLARINSLLKVNRLNKKMISIENILISMANTIESKDTYTQGHTQRVSDLAVALGKKMDLSVIETDALRLSGILHDVGKIGVPEEILNKPGPLNPDEWQVIKRHPAEAYRICLPLKKTLGPALEAIRHHHEKIDGSGYPDGIKGEEISILARILAVVDIFDALDTDRPYRKGMTRDETFKILCKEANDGKLDKSIVVHLMDMLGHKTTEF